MCEPWSSVCRRSFRPSERCGRRGRRGSGSAHRRAAGRRSMRQGSSNGGRCGSRYIRPCARQGSAARPQSGRLPPARRQRAGRGRHPRPAAAHSLALSPDRSPMLPVPAEHSPCPGTADTALPRRRCSWAGCGFRCPAGRRCGGTSCALCPAGCRRSAPFAAGWSPPHSAG